MRIRRDSVFVSGLLFTIALLCLVPGFLRAAQAGHDEMALRALAAIDPGLRAEAARTGDLGTASLAVICIGLIVIRMGYVHRVRWTWLIMFIIAWVWAFPLLVLPILGHRRSVSLSEWIFSALYQPGSARAWAESVLVFALMAIALLLPLRCFFLPKTPLKPISGGLLGVSAVGILVVLIAALAWVHTRSYSLTPAELNSSAIPAPHHRRHHGRCLPAIQAVVRIATSNLNSGSPKFLTPK
jgi:hypothetical protein